MGFQISTAIPTNRSPLRQPKLSPLSSRAWHSEDSGTTRDAACGMECSMVWWPRQPAAVDEDWRGRDGAAERVRVNISFFLWSEIQWRLCKLLLTIAYHSDQAYHPLDSCTWWYWFIMYKKLPTITNLYFFPQPFCCFHGSCTITVCPLPGWRYLCL